MSEYVPWQGNGSGVYHFVTYLPDSPCAPSGPEKVLGSDYCDDPSITIATSPGWGLYTFGVQGAMMDEQSPLCPNDGQGNVDKYLYAGAPVITYAYTYRFNRGYGHTEFDTSLSVPSPLIAHRIQLIVDTCIYRTDSPDPNKYPFNNLTVYFQPGYTSPQYATLSTSGNDSIDWEQNYSLSPSGNLGQLAGSVSNNDRAAYLRTDKNELLAYWYNSSYDAKCQWFQILGTYTDCNGIYDGAISIVNHRYDVNWPLDDSWYPPHPDANPGIVEHRNRICNEDPLRPQFGVDCVNPTWSGTFDSGTHYLGAY